MPERKRFFFVDPFPYWLIKNLKEWLQTVSFWRGHIKYLLSLLVTIVNPFALLPLDHSQPETIGLIPEDVDKPLDNFYNWFDSSRCWQTSRQSSRWLWLLQSPPFPGNAHLWGRVMVQGLGYWQVDIDPRAQCIGFHWPCWCLAGR